MARPPDTSPSAVKNWAWFALVVGVAGVIAKVWTKTEFANSVGLVLGLLWQFLVILVTSIPDIIQTARDNSG